MFEFYSNCEFHISSFWSPIIAAFIAVSGVILTLWQNRKSNTNKRKLRFKDKTIALCEKLKTHSYEMVMAHFYGEYYWALWRHPEIYKERAYGKSMYFGEKASDFLEKYNLDKAKLLGNISSLSHNLLPVEQMRIKNYWKLFDEYHFKDPDEHFTKPQTIDQLKVEFSEALEKLHKTLNKHERIPGLNEIQEMLNDKFFPIYTKAELEAKAKANQQA